MSIEINLFIDTFNRYGFKTDSSAMDGLNKFFKIHNKYRREHFMFRTICILFSIRQKQSISKMQIFPAGFNTNRQMENLLNQYHSLFLTKDEVKEIFRLTSDKTLRQFKDKFGLRKHGRLYLASDVRKTINYLTEEAA